MRLERVKRWQWIGVALVVGLALAWARRVDDDLPSRLGEGVADRNWFEREIRRRVTLADGSTVPAFSRLKVYPLTIRERGGRRPVHVVAGMYLAEVDDAAGDNASSAVGKLRPFFFIAPVPYQSLDDARVGKAARTDSTVRDYLDGLRGNGVSYTYAWWADARYATAAWVGGSIVAIGVLWPTLLNLLVYGRFLAPPREKGVSLWNVKPAAGTSRQSRDAVVQPDHGWPSDPLGISTTTDLPPAAEAGAAVAPRPVPLVLSVSPEDKAPLTAADPHKEFGAKRDDFYPTELKANAKTPA